MSSGEPASYLQVVGRYHSHDEVEERVVVRVDTAGEIRVFQVSKTKDLMQALMSSCKGDPFEFILTPSIYSSQRTRLEEYSSKTRGT